MIDYKNKTVWLGVVCAMCFGLTKPASAQIFKHGKKNSTKESVNKKSEYDKFIDQKPVTVDGFVKMHRVKDKLYFELPKKLLEHDMLLGSTVSEISNNGNAIIGQKPQEPIHFRFSKLDNAICMKLVSSDNVVDDRDTMLYNAMQRSNIDAIMCKFKITAYNNDSTSMVFDVTDLFVGDDKRISPFDPYSANVGGKVSRTEIFSNDKSFLGEIKGFVDNITVRSTLTYTYSLSGGGANAKDVPFTAVMTRSIVMLPNEPYKERVTDSRIGIFPTGKYLYSGVDQRTKIIYYANRWRLEPSDKEAYLRGEKVSPIKQIVFYIDPSFPARWKPYIHEGVNQWKELFEQIGFKDAICAKEYPADDKEFDPDNIKYSCIRYAPIPVANAMGPSWVDPRSGEIINASVYVYHDVIQLLNNWMFVQLAQTNKAIRSVELPQEIIGDGLRYVISHEVGHCLGFMHNMGASSVFPVDSLRSPSFTQKYGTTPCIMDYARFNYVAQPGDAERGVKLTPPRFGAYDRFTVKWNYTWFADGMNADSIKKITSEWITASYKDPMLHYGKQQFEMIDPSAQSEDLGDDAVKASRYGINNLKYIMSNLNEWVVGKDDDYSYRSAIYNSVIGQYFQYLNHIYANVGGIYLNEKLADDPVEAYCSVPHKRQKESLIFLLEQISDLDWIDNSKLMKNLTLMGSPADVLRSVVMQAVIGSPAKVDLSASKAKSDPYTVEECLEDVYKYVWGPTMNGGKLTPTQIKMQNMSVEFLAAGAGVKLDKTTTKSFAVTNGIPVPEFLASEQSPLRKSLCIHEGCRYRSFNPVAGYDDPMIEYYAPREYDAIYYGYLQKIRALLERNRNAADKESAMHYRLLAHKLTQAFK